jgi:hypothetical protein
MKIHERRRKVVVKGISPRRTTRAAAEKMIRARARHGKVLNTREALIEAGLITPRKGGS